MSSDHPSQRLSRFATVAIRVSTLLSGAILMSLEILAFRIIGKTFGSALRETSVVISVFLTAMCLGYYLGGRVADRYPRLRTLVGALLFAAGTIALVPWADGLLSERVFHSGLPLAMHSTIVTIVLFFLPTVFLASVSPIAIRLVVSGVERTGTTAGSISALSTFGSIAGSVGTAFVLIDYFESVQRTVYALALTAVILAALTFVSGSARHGQIAALWRQRRMAAVSAGTLLLGVPLVALSWFLAQPIGLDQVRGGMEFGSEVVFEKDSTFHHIRVVDHNRLRTLFFDVTAQTQISLDDPSEGGFAYTDAFHLAMVMNPEIRRVLAIGLGGGTAPMRFTRDYPGVTVDVVEIDPAVVDVAREWFYLREGPRLSVHLADGRSFVRRAKGQYDLIMVDAYTTNNYGSTIPAHLTTREFFKEVTEKLSPDGIVAYNCAASPEAVITRAISKTMYRALPYQMAVKATINTVLLGSREDIRMAPAELKQRIESMRAAGTITIRNLEDHTPVPLQYAGVPILTDEWSPVDRLMRQ